MKKYFLILLFSLGIYGCTGVLEDASILTPAPARSEYLLTKAAGFNGIAQGGKLRDLSYSLSLRVVKEIGKDVSVETCFENPEDFGRPVCAEGLLKQGEKELSISSPVMTGFINKHNYEVLITLRDANTSTVLGTHKQLIRYYEVTF